MKRATLHIIVQSVCCAKIKGVDLDELARDSSGSEAQRDDPATDSSESP